MIRGHNKGHEDAAKGGRDYSRVPVSPCTLQNLFVYMYSEEYRYASRCTDKERS